MSDKTIPMVKIDDENLNGETIKKALKAFAGIFNGIDYLLKEFRKEPFYLAADGNDTPFEWSREEEYALTQALIHIEDVSVVFLEAAVDYRTLRKHLELSAFLPDE